MPERGDRPSRACRGRGGSHIGGLGRVIYCVQSYTSSTGAPTPFASRARLKAFSGAKCDIGAGVSAVGQGGVSLRRTLRTIMQSGSAPSGEKGTRQAPHAWRRLFTARWWLVPAATRPGEAGVVPAHVPLTRISSLAPNLRARAEICPRLPSQATSTTSDGEAATPPKNRMVPPPASVDEHRGSAGPARQVHCA